MITLIFTAVLSFALYVSYMLGRCSAIHDLCRGADCEDLKYWEDNWHEKHGD